MVRLSRIRFDAKRLGLMEYSRIYELACSDELEFFSKFLDYVFIDYYRNLIYFFRELLSIRLRLCFSPSSSISLK